MLFPKPVRRVSRSGQQYTNWFSGSYSRSDEITEVRWHHNRRRFHPYCDWYIGSWASRPFTSSWKSAADWQLWPTNHVQQRFYVSVFRCQFNVATPSAWRGHFSARTQRSLRFDFMNDNCRCRHAASTLMDLIVFLCIYVIRLLYNNNNNNNTKLVTLQKSI